MTNNYKTTFALMLAVLVSLFSPMFAVAADKDFEGSITAAREFTAQKKYKEALAELLEASLYAKGADVARLHAERGAVYRAAGDLMSAIVEYEESVKAAGSDPCGRAEQALFFESVGEMGASQASAGKSLDAGCVQPRLMNLMGRIYMWRSDSLDALDYFYEALSDSEERPSALKELGAVFMTFGFTDPAISYLKEADKLDKNNSSILSLLADAYSMSGRMEESLDYYRRALEIEPKNSVAANNYGYTLFMMRRADEAMAVMEKLNKEAPSSYSICNVMEISLYKGDFDTVRKSGQTCLEAIQKDPGFADYERYYLSAAQLAVRLAYEDQQQLHPQTLLDQMRQNEKGGDLNEALSDAIVALMLEPDNAEALLEAGRMYMVLGEHVKGAPFLTLAMARGGRNSEIEREARRLLNNNAFTDFGAEDAGMKWFSAASK